MLGKSIAALGLSCLLATAPARADIRAEYVDTNGRVSTIVEVDQRGQVRMGSDWQGYYLATTEGEFFVEPGPGGPVAVAVEASEWLQRGKPRNVAFGDSPEWRYGPAEKVQIGGHEGQAYRPVGPNVPEHLPSIAISTDPALAPIAQAMMRQNRAFQLRNGWTPTLDRYMALMQKGAVLDDANRKLGAVSFDPIPPERFKLPVEPVTLAQVRSVRPVPGFNQPEDAGPRRSVIQAAFFDGQLWTLDDSGGMATTLDGGSGWTAADVPERPIALCRGAAGLWLVTRSSGEVAPGLWLRAAGGDWTLHGRVPVEPTSRWIGAECSGDLPWLLFSDRLVEGAAQRVLTFDPEALPGRPGYSSLSFLDGALYLAMNNGEWGGGIHRITLPERASGQDKPEIVSLCSDANPAACGAITGIAADPSRPGCLLATRGLVHFLPSGEVVRVCGTSAERIYRKPYTMDPNWSEATFEWERSLGTVPFYALAAGDHGIWAVATDGVYRFGNGAPEFRRFPPLRSGAIDWSQPGIVLVPTDMNQRHSLSGGSLLLAVR